MSAAAPFTHAMALGLFARIVAGWAERLDKHGARAWLDGIPNHADAGGSYEAVTRILWAVGGWLSQPGRPSVISRAGASYDLAALLERAIRAGTDPASPAYWGVPVQPGAYDQRTVEAGQVAFSLWQSRAHARDHWDTTTRGQVIAWLAACGAPPAAWHNNRALFWVLNHASRAAPGAPHDRAVIASGLTYLDRVAVDEWYDDAAQRGERHFDDDNWWVFTTHELAWIETDGASDPARADWFAADGAYPEYGRSLAYKFARLAAPLWAWRHGLWPHGAGMLRRLVGRHLRWYIDRGALRADGSIRQSLTAQGSPAIIEPYISTGAVYWAMLAFGALWALPDDDPFWHEPEAPLPVERGDMLIRIAPAGWLLVGQHAGGAVHRYNAGSQGSDDASYGKFLYASDAAFNPGRADGMATPDSMLCPRYRQSVGGASHAIDTVIVVAGAWHLRIHHIWPAQGVAVGAVEGASTLGFDHGAAPRLGSDAPAGLEWAAVAGRVVAIRRIRGYSSQQRAAAWRGRHDVHAIYGDYVVPLLHIDRAAPAHQAICVVYTGPLAGWDAAVCAAMQPAIACSAEGAMTIDWHGRRIHVPAPPGQPA
ncbi:MAG: DUF2264 domain-containing protein [Chloroflexi bacterium]|nr:DUF2264 domain-containing protein [Chloroflexota bacterium]